ncbi:MAG: MotA/TolQ/ExbB proton channel family protein [Eubacterium sp.]|nr:MotA/TolQ/ExbB proton channel family protein [Eubacterium sp.]
MSSTTISSALRTICSSLQTPVIIILFCILAFTLVLVGTLVAEGFTERIHLKVWMPRLVDEIKSGEQPPAVSIKQSGLLKRQKTSLIEVTDHKELTDNMREALAIRLIEEAKGRYDIIVKCSDTIIRLGPVFGLLGTLIPLGPGILALGQGDTYTLSNSLLTAFDTTVLGLICAAIATVISTIRKRWYANDLSILESLMDCVLEVEKSDDQ